jgi:hypothetical protein
VPDVERPATSLYPSGQPKPPSLFGWLFIATALLAINDRLGQIALHHQQTAKLKLMAFAQSPAFLGLFPLTFNSAWAHVV